MRAAPKLWRGRDWPAAGPIDGPPGNSGGQGAPVSDADLARLGGYPRALGANVDRKYLRGVLCEYVRYTRTPPRV